MDVHLLLRTFLLVAKLGNITQAAEQLNFTQPAVTGQIRTLEEHFGVLLFERVGKKLYITEAGRQLVTHAERLLAAYDETFTALQAFSDRNTPIRLGASTTTASYILPPILRDFQNRIAGSVLVDICPNFPTTVKGLIDNTFDLAIVHDKIDNNHFVQFELFAHELVWVAQRNLVAENNGSLDIGLYQFINHKPGCVFRTQYEKILGAPPIDSAIEYSDCEAIKRAVLEGLGVAVLPHVSVESLLADGSLVEFANQPRLDFVISIAFHKNKVLSPAQRALLAVFAEHATLPNGLEEFLCSR